jgi:VanZ family protein
MKRFKIIKKMLFYYLNLPQTVNMIRNNKFSILISLMILYLSLANAKTFEKAGLFDIKYLDKLVHFGLYFLFTITVIYEHRNQFSNTRQLLLTALIPFSFGTIIEFMQSDFTRTRSGDIIDVIANTAGIIAALYLWLLIKPYYNKKLK